MSTDEAAARLRHAQTYYVDTAYVKTADLRAILDERDTFVRQVEDVIRRSGDDVAAAREERDALRARLEAAEAVWKTAEDTTWAFAALGGVKLNEYVESLRHVCREYRERFGGRDG